MAVSEGMSFSDTLRKICALSVICHEKTGFVYHSRRLIETVSEVVYMDAFKHVEQEEAVEDDEVEFTHLDQPDNV